MPQCLKPATTTAAAALAAVMVMVRKVIGFQATLLQQQQLRLSQVLHKSSMRSYKQPPL
jgi:hypothetical protein